MLRGVSIDISGVAINRFLLGPKYTPPPSNLYEVRDSYITKDNSRDNPISRVNVLKWIAQQIAIEGAEAAWVTDAWVPITKATLTFAAKFWWAVVCARFRPTGNDNIPLPTQENLVACIMARYGMNEGRLIATEMRDRALSDKAALPFPCLIKQLCLAARVPMNPLCRHENHY